MPTACWEWAHRACWEWDPAMVPATETRASCVVNNCISGNFASIGGCTACQGGRFQPNSNHAISTCNSCEPGKFLNATGQSTNLCTPCNAGTSTNGQVGQGFCVDCIAGMFAASSGDAKCLDCSVGRYENETGAVAACKNCTSGRTSLRVVGINIKRITCQDCGRGWYVASGDPKGCQRCPKGRFQENEASPTCTFCVAGMFQSSTGQSDSSACKACSSITSGKYSPAGSALCQKCTGKKDWQDVSGQSECKTCAPGLVANQYNTRCECAKACAPGTFLNPDTVNTIVIDPV